MMRHRSRSFRGIVAASLAVGAVFFVALVFVPLVSASPVGGADAFSIDMDPANAPANTATTLGSREACSQINENDLLDADEDVNADELQIDVTVTNLPPETAMIAFAFSINYSAANLAVTGRDGAYLLGVNPGSSLLDVSGDMPDTDGTYNGAVVDFGDGALESGSGILQRITIASTGAAASGEYGLILSEAAHIDSLNEPHAPDILNNASVAINQACGEGPIETPIPTASPVPSTPTPPPPSGTPAPTPGPGVAALGVDHDGGAPDINPGPTIANPNATVSVVAEAPPEGIGAWTVDVHFDPAVLDPVGCVPHPSGLCNENFSVIEVRIVGASALGQFGTVNLADITFAAVGGPGSCSSLDLEVVTFTDPEGTDLAVAVSNGGVCVSDLPAPTPGPGVAVLGVDHDGGAPDINHGPAIANPNATVSVVAESPPEGIGAWTVDVHYDPAVLSVVDCVPHGDASVCNPAFSVVEVRFTGATASGLFGTVNLADITFAAVGPASSCSSLDLEVDTFVDPTGTDLAVNVSNGGVCVDGGPCEPAPANDEIANATPVGPLPFLDATDTTCGTTAADDPSCMGGGRTVWYMFTPAESGFIEANTFGSSYDTTLSAYSGAPGSLLQIACNDDSGSLQSRVLIPVSAGETYYFMAGSFFGGPGGFLQFTVQEYEPLEIGVTIDPAGSVIPRDGVAMVRGTYSCSKPAEMEIYGELSQRAGRAVVNAWIYTTVTCDGYGVWEAEAVPDGEMFAGGTAEAALSAVGFTFDEAAFDEAAGDVRLTGTKPPRLTRCGRDGNLGFESGMPDSSDIPCWTAASLGYGGWCTQAGALTPAGDCDGGSFVVAAPPVGAQAAMTNQGGAGAHVLYQCGVLRAGAISLQLYILNLAGVFVSPPTLDPFGSFFNQQVRVDLVRADAIAADPFTTGAGDVLMNLYQSQPGDPVESGYSTVEADASAYVGEDVCLRVAEVDNVFFLNAGIDDVRISLRQSH